MDAQEYPPELLLGAGSLIGDFAGRGLAFNVQNLLGNWLMLVGQALITFNAQQQFLENGSGRFYALGCKNVDAEGQTVENKSSRDEGLEVRVARLEQQLAELVAIISAGIGDA